MSSRKTSNRTPYPVHGDVVHFCRMVPSGIECRANPTTGNLVTDQYPRPAHLYDAYVFDLDGTVYLGDALLPTAGETIRTLRQQGRRTVFLSNNPTHSRREYAAKLTRLGLPTPV